MNVTLLSYTPNAVDLLIFTKSTRLGITPDRMAEIKKMSEEEKMAELDYMANTLPSSWEFCDFTFLVEGVSRAYTHQQVRTRTGSYAQQAMRVTDMTDFDYIFTEPNKQSPEALQIINTCCQRIKESYTALKAIGQATEDARGVLPTNIGTNIVVKFNLRSMADLVKSRAGGRTQSEYQAVVNGMVEAILAVYPWAEKFLFAHGKDFFTEIEEFAAKKFTNQAEQWELLKIVDKMRKQL